MGKFSFLNVAAVRRSYQDFMKFRFLIQLQLASLADLKAKVESGIADYQGCKVDLPIIINLATQGLERKINDEVVTATDRLDLINQYSHLNSVANSLTKALSYNFSNKPSVEALLEYLDTLTCDSLEKVTLAIKKGYFDHYDNAVDWKVRESLMLLIMAAETHESDVKKSIESADREKAKIVGESSSPTSPGSFISNNNSVVRCIKCNQSLNILTGRKIKITCPVCKESWLHST